MSSTPWGKRAADRARQVPIPLVPSDDPVLREPARPVEAFGHEDLDVLAHRMYLTCLQHRGAAIAAPQVGVPLRLVVVAAPQGHGVVFCNPVIEAGGATIDGPESCLSLPGRQFRVPRRNRVVVVGQDINGDGFGGDAVGHDARMWQHELMHLEGRLLVDEFPEIQTIRF